MNIGIAVDITVKDENGTYLTFPVLPSKISYKDGSGKPITVSVLDIGDVDFYNGTELDELTFSSFFPARYDPGYCSYADLKKPTEYRNQLSSWKGGNSADYTGEAAHLQVIIPAAGLNKAMKIATFEWDFQGFEGDIYYNITFKEDKRITPIQISSGVVVAEEARTAEPVPEIVQEAKAEITTGSMIKFKGGPVYVSANATNAATTAEENANCKCTNVYSGAHSIHLVSQNGPTVYGWVDADNCEVI